MAPCTAPRYASITARGRSGGWSHASLPDAVEIMKFDMPGFSVGEATIAGYAAFSRQCGLYLSPDAITALADDLAAAGLKVSKTGVTFSPAKPIPDDLVRRLALASRENLGV